MLKKIVSNAKRIVGSQHVEEPTYSLTVDSPARTAYASRELVVSGWIIPIGETTINKLRVLNNGVYTAVDFGLPRPDVAEIVDPNLQLAAQNCGFSTTITFEDGGLEIEADFGEGFKNIYKTSVQYSTENLVEMLVNPNLGQLMAEHKNLLEGRKRYFWERAATKQYERHQADPKLITFYLPQFHPIAENDQVWGRGFTEWTNVTTAEPRFVGHQQPLLPADLGFYDLRLDETIAQQIDLAKAHGIYGFCMYYYWFSGKKLLEKPLDALLRHQEWDFNFAICWANENWTKRWDGRNDDIIIAQKYRRQDPLDFIKDVEHILLDPRYIKVAGKPVLIVYRASELQDPVRYARIWRQYFKKQHDQELYIVSVLGFETVDPRSYGFDAGINFAPLTQVQYKDAFPGGELPLVDIHSKVLDNNYEGGIVDYRKVALKKDVIPSADFPVYDSVMPSWDNEARKKGKGASFYKVSPDIYAAWLDRTLDAAVKAPNPEPFVFINAWNEWAEGAVLEPTLHQGHAILNRTTEVLAKYSHNTNNQKNFPLYGLKPVSKGRTAVIVHAYYASEWAYIRSRLAMLSGVDYDLFVTINQKDMELSDVIRAQFPNCHVIVVPNRGRDILPFLHLLHQVQAAGYEYVLKLHTKKSLHRDNGAAWRESLIGELLPNKAAVGRIIKNLATGAALVAPSDHYISTERYIGSNMDTMGALLEDMRLNDGQSFITDPRAAGYIAGSMFWARIDALQPIIDLYLLPDDFEAESGQIDGTLAHAVERLFTIVPAISGKKMLLLKDSALLPMTESVPQETYRFAP